MNPEDLQFVMGSFSTEHPKKNIEKVVSRKTIRTLIFLRSGFFSVHAFMNLAELIGYVPFFEEEIIVKKYFNSRKNIFFNLVKSFIWNWWFGSIKRKSSSVNPPMYLYLHALLGRCFLERGQCAEQYFSPVLHLCC